MNLKIKKSKKHSIESFLSHPQININPIFIVAKKTLIFNVSTIKKLIVSTFLMIIVPVLVLFFYPSTAFTSESTLTEALGLILFFYTYGLIFPLLISAAASPLISEEIKSGTMITLVSKPISRPGIVAGKLFALYFYGILVNCISILIMMLIGIIRYPFPDLVQFFFIHFIYGLIIITCFGGLTLGISCIFKKPRNVTLIPVFIIIFSFLIGLFIKQFLLIFSLTGGDSNLYEEFLIYNFDISYHMANIYKWFNDLYVPGATDGWGFFLLMFGVTKYDLTPYCNEIGECSRVWGVTTETNYYLPILSVILLILLGILLLIGGIYYFSRRDIS